MSKKKQGSVLVYGLIIISITGIVMSSLIQFVISNTKLGFNVRTKEQATQISEAGVYFYRWYLGHNLEGRTIGQINTFWNSALGVDSNNDGDCDDASSAPDNFDADSDGDIDSDDSDGKESYKSEYLDDNGNIVGYYEICVTKPSRFYPFDAKIKVIGYTNDKPNIKRTVSATIKRTSFAQYAILLNKFGEFDEDIDIYGPIFGNEGIKLDNVTVHNIVYAGVKEYYDGSSVKDGVNSSTPDKFKVGTSYPVQKIDFENAVPNFEIAKNIAIGDGLYFDEEGFGRHIYFSGGVMNISIVTEYDKDTYEIISESSSTAYPVPTEGVLYVNDNVWVDGELPSNTKFTILAHDSRIGYEPNIYIGYEDLVYSDNRTSLLGLMAEDNIFFVKNSRSSLDISAILFAMNGSVGWIPPEGTDWSDKNLSIINIFGSIISNKKMKFKYPGYGFGIQNIVFDAKIQDIAPPMFPADGIFVITKWYETQ